MKDLNDLNHWLRERANDELPKEPLLVQRNYFPEKLARLPLECQVRIGDFCRRLETVLPDDFDYTLFLGGDEPSFGVVYQDGPQTVCSCPVELDEARLLLEQLAEVDWGVLREDSLRRGQTMDTIKEEGAKLPSKLPSTQALQEKFAHAMKDFLKTARQTKAGVSVLKSQDYKRPKTERFETMEQFERELPDMMTVHELIIAVVADGKPLSISRLESLKKQALKELEGMPISYAKALMKI